MLFQTRTTIQPIKQANVIRLTTMQAAADGTIHKIMLIDEDESFDIVVQYPDGQREAVWSLIK